MRKPSSAARQGLVVVGAAANATSTVEPPTTSLAPLTLPTSSFVTVIAEAPDAEERAIISIVSQRLGASPLGEREMRLISAAGQLLLQAVGVHRQPGASSTGLRAVDVDEGAPDRQPAETLVRYYEADDSVLIDGEYLIRGVAGRLFWLLLTLRDKEGRSTFLNRELRCHPFLKLSSYKDNLESRLLNLKRRLEEKQVPIRLERDMRGRVRLDCDVQTKLERIAA